MKKKTEIPSSTPRSPPVSDRDLMEGIQKGDIDSFHQLYQRFSGRLRKYALKHTDSLATAEDLAQDVLLKIYQFKQTYNSNYEVSTWIWAIAKNTVYDYFRRTRWQTKNSFPINEEVENEDHAELMTDNAESILIQEAEKESVQKLFLNLSDKQKKALFLRLVKNFSYHEISNSLNISLSAVKSLMNRAKTTLIKAQRANTMPVKP